MTLTSTLHEALELTRRLEAALEAGDLEACRELLALRATAMADFESAHRQAGERQLVETAVLVRNLVEADRELQERNRQLLAENARLLQDSRMSTPTPGHAYNTSEPPSCVDRKA